MSGEPIDVLRPFSNVTYCNNDEVILYWRIPELESSTTTHISATQSTSVCDSKSVICFTGFSCKSLLYGYSIKELVAYIKVWL